MQRLSAYRFELKLNGAQQRQCAQFADVKRYIYNKVRIPAQRDRPFQQYDRSFQIDRDR